MSTEQTNQHTEPEPPVATEFRWPLVGFGLICAITFAGSLLFFLIDSRIESQEVKHYWALKKTMDEIREARVSNPGALPELQSRLATVAKQVAHDFHGKANRYTPSRQILLWVSRDSIPEYLAKGLQNADSPEEIMVENRLKDAAYELGLEKRR